MLLKKFSTQLIFLAYTLKVIIARNIEDILFEDTTHPNSVYSQISKHNNNNFHHNKDLRIFFQTGVSYISLLFY